MSLAYDTHFRCMECGLRIYIISNAVDHPDHILIQDRIRRLRILQRRQAPTMDHHRLPLLIVVGEEGDLGNLHLLALGEFVSRVLHLTSFCAY